MNLTSYLQNRQLTVALTGEIDHHTAKAILTDLTEKLDCYMPTKCILDYKDVCFMDSSGIAIVIFMLRRMREVGGELLLQNVGPQPMKVMQAAGVNRLVKIKEVCQR